jgi:hypothetical protein
MGIGSEMGRRLGRDGPDDPSRLLATVLSSPKEADAAQKVLKSSVGP